MHDLETPTAGELLAEFTHRARLLAHPDNPIHSIDATSKSGTNDRQVILDLADASIAGDRLTMSELAARVGMSRAAITALVDRLEAAGAIERHPDEKDRRRTFLALTVSAAALVEEALDWKPTRTAGEALRESADRAAAQRFAGATS